MKKYLSITVFAFMAMSLLYPSLVHAQTNHPPVGQGGAGSWRLLGERVINFTADKVIINVTGADVFRKFKI